MSGNSSDLPVEPAGLRARLLGAEPPDVVRLNRLRLEVQHMCVEKLDRRKRISWSVTLGLSLAAAALGGYVTTHINAPDSVASPRLLRAVWAVFTIGMTASAGYAASVLRAGQVNLRNRPRRARVKLLIALVTATLLVVQAVTHPTIPMLAWAVFGLIWVVVSAANKVISRVDLAELATREALLRLELRLAEGPERR